MATHAAPSRIEVIARLNDRVRYGLDRTARIHITPACLFAVAGEDADELQQILAQGEIIAALRCCRFDADCPERDFAAFECRGHTIWFKIDSYGPTLEFGSDDPADASITTRVMTIMLPGDY